MHGSSLKKESGSPVIKSIQILSRAERPGDASSGRMTRGAESSCSAGSRRRDGPRKVSEKVRDLNVRLVKLKSFE
jgi:hypothetical protein